MTDEQRTKIDRILDKYKSGTCSAEELAWLNDFYLRVEQNSDLPSDLDLVTDLIDLQSRIGTNSAKQNSGRLSWWKLTSIAAAAILCISLGLFFWFKKDPKAIQKESLQIAKEILPGKNRAILILDGSENIAINGEHDSLISLNGQLHYGNGQTINTKDQIRQITLKTPNAGQFEAILPDGTKAWLNAASSISYPSEFSEDKREVQLTGEVFLEVAKDSRKPFVVETSKQQIQVLGTSFNVQAYENQKYQYTTLQEGSLKIIGSTGQGSKILKPGQQAVVSDQHVISVQEVPLETISSWKDGVYVVQDLTLAEFGVQLARWYDIEVDMGRHKDKKLSAMIPRDVPLATVLEAITLNTQINFKVKERRVSTVD